MFQCAATLGRTDQTASAAGHGFALGPLDGGAANRTLCGQFDGPGAHAIRLFLGDTSDFGNDVTGTAHDDTGAYAYTLALYFVHVVQSGIRYRDAADEHRLQMRHR